MRSLSERVEDATTARVVSHPSKHDTAETLSR